MVRAVKTLWNQYVTLAIGGDSGATSVTAAISGAAPSVKAAMSR
jgi:hypothetical protein